MKMQMIDSLDKDEARESTGCKVIDERGEPVGTVHQAEAVLSYDPSRFLSLLVILEAPLDR
jgi:hypothetical protein